MWRASCSSGEHSLYFEGLLELRFPFKFYSRGQRKIAYVGHAAGCEIDFFVHVVTISDEFVERQKPRKSVVQRATQLPLLLYFKVDQTPDPRTDVRDSKVSHFFGE